MQLLRDHQTLVATVRDINMMSTMSAKDAAPENFEIKEKHSSNGSLLLMNPVASGDNVTTGLSSAHRLKDEPLPAVPPLVPCCEGRELQINEDLVRTGLSAISVKHDNSVIQCLSMSQACERMLVPPGLVKHRNSFRSLHRPDLKRVPYLRRLSPVDLETLFRGYADLPTKRDYTDSRGASSKSAKSPEERRESRKEKDTVATVDDGNTGGSLRPIIETRSSCPTDVPAGMRLHGARARLYTSVLAGARAGDQLDGSLANEEYDARVPEDLSAPEDEVQLHEELQIILPPQATGQSTSSTTADSASIVS